MRVGFLDLQASYEGLQEQLEEAALRSLRSGCYIGGPELASFEAEFAAYCEVTQCVGVANGLEALQLALMALDIGEGSEVIVPSNTFIATWLAVSHAGARCVPVEPDPRTYNMDPERIAGAIGPATRAIMPVHLYGQPADMDAILGVAAAHGLAVIEDAAQAHGARYKGRRVGGLSPLSTWSFYPGKNLGALGDAGAITTDDENLADRLSLLRNYGSPVRYTHDERGFNSRLDPVQAAVLRVKLAHLDQMNARRAAIAEQYALVLSAASTLTLPYVPNYAEPSWHLYCVRHKRRDALRDELYRAGVETLIHYPVPPHRQQAYADAGWAEGSFPIAESLASQLLSLPIDPMMTDAQVEFVAHTTAEIAEKLA